MSVLAEIVRERQNWATSGMMAARRNKRLKIALDLLLVGACAVVFYFYHETILAFVSSVMN